MPGECFKIPLKALEVMDHKGCLRDTCAGHRSAYFQNVAARFVMMVSRLPHRLNLAPFRELLGD
jgi:hypothetical protein